MRPCLLTVLTLAVENINVTLMFSPCSYSWSIVEMIAKLGFDKSHENQHSHQISTHPNSCSSEPASPHYRAARSIASYLWTKTPHRPPPQTPFPSRSSPRVFRSRPSHRPESCPTFRTGKRRTVRALALLIGQDTLLLRIRT